MQGIWARGEDFSLPPNGKSRKPLINASYINQQFLNTGSINQHFPSAYRSMTIRL